MNEQSFIMMKYIYPVWVVKVKEKMKDRADSYLELRFALNRKQDHQDNGDNCYVCFVQMYTEK
jgi:hypothetical protein